MIVLHRAGNSEPAMVRYRNPTDQEAGDELDLVAIERTLGDEFPPAPLTIWEARLAGRLIVDPNNEIRASEIAHLLGVHSRTVVRWRSERRTELTEGSRTVRTTIERGERWQDRAICRNTSTDDFFPDGEVGTAAQIVYREAAKVCSRCPVAQQCLRAAMKAEGSRPAKARFGVFGGLAPAERDALYRTRAQATARAAAGGPELAA